MACRVPISDVAKAIDRLQEDGGVILTGFATPHEVTRVNDDAAPYLEAAAEEVQPSITGLCSRSLIMSASLEWASQGHTPVPPTVRAQPDGSREVDATIRGHPDPQPLP